MRSPITQSTNRSGEEMLDPERLSKDGPWACLKPNLKRRIWTLRDGQCRWPLWDELPERDGDRFYCGMPVRAAAYCAHHCRLAFGGWRE
jgi:hypothetical protein